MGENHVSEMAQKALRWFFSLEGDLNSKVENLKADQISSKSFSKYSPIAQGNLKSNQNVPTLLDAQVYIKISILPRALLSWVAVRLWVSQSLT